MPDLVHVEPMQWATPLARWTGTWPRGAANTHHGVPHRGVGGAHRGAYLGQGLAGLVAAADLVHVESTAVPSVAARTSYFDHPSDIADGDAKAGG